MALRLDELEKLLHVAIVPLSDPTLERRFNDAHTIPDGVQQWFETLPAYTAATEAIPPLRDAAIEAA